MNKKIRVYYADRIPVRKETIIDVDTIEEAKKIVSSFAERDLNDDRITDNLIFIQEFDGEDWVELEEED